MIGLGAMGAHAVQQVAARGQRVIGIERFGPLHDRGSSHGDSRLIRLGYFEDPAYVPLLRRGYANWRALERLSGEGLRSLADNGDLLARRPRVKETEREALVPALARAAWYDPATKGPRA